MTTQKIAGGYGDKFRLLDTVACDSRGSRATVAVMAVILRRFNAEHGCCWPSIESIASDADLDGRTVQRALDSLEELGYLHTVRNRGKLNRYVPHFQAQRAPGSNCVGAVGDADKGRHSRPPEAANKSKRDGLDAVTPTASTPPEYLNESIPKKEKEKGEALSSFGNQEKERGSGTSDDSLSSEAFPPGSPERRAQTGLGILATSVMLGGGYLPDRDKRLEAMKAQYLELCEARGSVPNEQMLAAFRKGAP